MRIFGLEEVGQPVTPVTPFPYLSLTMNLTPRKKTTKDAQNRVFGIFSAYFCGFYRPYEDFSMLEVLVCGVDTALHKN